MYLSYLNQIYWIHDGLDRKKYLGGFFHLVLCVSSMSFHLALLADVKKPTLLPGSIYVCTFLFH
uniref:Uncharacterized protein n=1 Tax=Arundo donax TaxID=35708 RepID=A0A0A9FZ75_ARUDO